MATRKNERIMKALQKKGFQSSDTHHIYLCFYYEGRKTSISTHISHHKAEIGNKLRSIMARQLKISGKEFDNLIDCSMSQKDLTEKYLEEGILKV